MWDELDTVDWASLEHNYGPATDVPALLRQCASGNAEQAGAARGDLSNKLFHQGGWICSAAPAALPFLMRLAVDQSVNHRPFIVELIGRIAREATIVEPQFVDDGWPSALALATPAMFTLLADPEPAVRREATLLVAEGGLPVPDAVRALLRRWDQEQDRITRWDLVLALGALAAKSSTPEPLRRHIHGELLHVLEQDNDPQLRLAAIHALAESEPARAAQHVGLLIEAVSHEDADGWQRSAWIGGTRATIVHRTGQLLRVDPVAAAAFTIGVSATGDVDRQVATLGEAGQLLAEWRTASVALLPFLAKQLDHPHAEVRYRAAFLLGCLGTDAAAFSDRLAALTDDPAVRDSRGNVTVGDAAVWALSRLDDPRCLPGFAERLTGDRLGFDKTSSHVGRHSFSFWQPGIQEALSPLSKPTATLIDAVTARLNIAASREDTVLVRNLCQVLADWGPAAQPALPALVRLLSSEQTWVFAAEALGRIGHAATPAASELKQRAEHDHHDADTAAWALWRVGGDPEHATEVLGRMIAADSVRPRAVKYLADLGQAAEASAGRLQRLLGSKDDWVRVEAAHALWRVSGDPTEAVPVLTTVLQPLTDGTYLPVMLPAMRYLAAIGRQARPAAAIAGAVLANPRRIAYFGSWRTFVEDAEIRAAASSLLARIR